ncbi:MAG: tRNA (adenosine(37)-N6)-threonylcarbamoyltransferase complex dimerization subunit type 1 TsaB [Gemmatimonadetes bacterium]|nr:tRNA (adenosine(37)-N6)-threonylcarbamoyltransferase complex dimerization subunit type 1 TsaB [Gemmatimonadota bacterium]
MRVLAIEMATRHGSVALLQDDDVVEVPVELRGDGVVAAIAELLAEERVDPEYLDLIAASVGPGSFTGVRIGTAAAQGLAEATEVPLVGVGTLDALAESVAGTDWAVPGTPILASVDARRAEVYAALYRVAGAGEPAEKLWGPEPVAFLALAERFAALGPSGENPGVLVGDGSALLAPLFPPESGWAAPAQLAKASAAAVGRVAAREAEAGRTVTPEALEPVYLRKSDAEIHRQDKLRQD